MSPKIPVGDLHCDTAMGLAAGKSLDDPSLHVNLPAMKDAGIGLQVFACYVPPSVPAAQKFDFARRMLDALDRQIDGHPDEITVCRTLQDILDARAEGRIAAVLAVENGDILGHNLKTLEILHARGVRLLTLVHSKSNDWIISSADPDPAFEGLTRFGEEVVAAMNRLGIIIDVSHAHDRAVDKVLDSGCRPVVASHSCAHALCPVPRNLRDGLIRDIASGEGLVGVNIYPGFLDGQYAAASKRFGDLFEALNREEEKAGADLVKHFEISRMLDVKFAESMKGIAVSLDRYLEHIFHIMNVAGDDHVAFGSDFDGIPALPEGIDGCRGLGLVRERLAEADLPRKSIEKICWTNFLRVFRSVCG